MEKMMAMKATITVDNKIEQQAIELALADPATRAFVTIIGILLPCTERTRARVMNFVTDKLEEESNGRR